MADQLREERLAILELLKDGKINSEQAEALLQALAPQAPKAPEAPVFVEPRGGKKNAFKMLRINIDGEDGEKVRINVPIEFAKVLGKGKFGNVNLDEFDIDIE